MWCVRGGRVFRLGFASRVPPLCMAACVVKVRKPRRRGARPGRTRHRSPSSPREQHQRVPWACMRTATRACPRARAVPGTRDCASTARRVRETRTLDVKVPNALATSLPVSKWSLGRTPSSMSFELYSTHGIWPPPASLCQVRTLRAMTNWVIGGREGLVLRSSAAVRASRAWRVRASSCSSSAFFLSWSLCDRRFFLVFGMARSRCGGESWWQSQTGVLSRIGECAVLYEQYLYRLNGLPAPGSSSRSSSSSSSSPRGACKVAAPGSSDPSSWCVEPPDGRADPGPLEPTNSQTSPPLPRLTITCCCCCCCFSSVAALRAAFLISSP